MYSTCALRFCGARRGRSLTGYVWSGNLSKSCLIGVGTVNRLRGDRCVAARPDWVVALFSSVCDIIGVRGV
jgi:hypothetical protein